jgi:methylglutaconyl-CoA hydratase
MTANVAHRLLLTGEVFDASTALAGGLADLVVPDEDVDATVTAQLAALSAGGPAALAEIKRLLRARSEPSPAEQFPALLRLSAGFFASDEGQEGIAAFREKRPARSVPSP